MVAVENGWEALYIQLSLVSDSCVFVVHQFLHSLTLLLYQTMPKGTYFKWFFDVSHAKNLKSSDIIECNQFVATNSGNERPGQVAVAQIFANGHIQIGSMFVDVKTGNGFFFCNETTIEEALNYSNVSLPLPIVPTIQQHYGHRRVHLQQDDQQLT